MATGLLDSDIGLLETEATAVIVIENSNTGSLVLADLIFRSNATTGLKGTGVIADTEDYRKDM